MNIQNIILDIARTSACDYDQAVRLLTGSNNYKRDSKIIKELKNQGISEKQVLNLLIWIRNQ